VNFTADMYDRILRTLADHGPVPADEPAGEHRVEPRAGVRGGASALVAGKPQPVRVRDVSHSGFGLLMGAPVTPGDHFAVTLAGAGAMSSLSIVCSAVYCRPAGHGLFTVGAKLVRFTPGPQ